MAPSRSYTGNPEPRRLEGIRGTEFSSQLTLNPNKTLRKFQEEAATGKDTIIIAPTGRGKTLASLNWWKSTGRKKLSVFLPTVTTVESMFENYRKEFGENTGLVHGNLAYYLYSNFDIAEDEFDEWETKKILDETFRDASKHIHN